MDFCHLFAVEGECVEGFGGFVEFSGFEEAFGFEGDAETVDPPMSEAFGVVGFHGVRGGEGAEGFGGVSGEAAAEEDAGGEGVGVPHEETCAG